MKASFPFLIGSAVAVAVLWTIALVLTFGGPAVALLGVCLALFWVRP